MLAAAATLVHLLFWQCSLLMLAFAVCCRSLAVLVLSTAAASVYLLLHLRCIISLPIASDVHCRLFAILALSAASAAVLPLSLSW
ncbi:hypothetical protein MAM1_0021c01826 [Mucor ambiguus]|uniref:Uncharacterized protein n=1 Tax=Mucor ambiguus TaxID=91626 RepID=A0A0C9MKK1_9FUNG|nr:hypothetical protein MAM1_0021c01826 [Mucor ambiguus]